MAVRVRPMCSGQSGPMAGEGHEERFPPPRLSVGCELRKETIAGRRRNGRDAPILDLPVLAPERAGSTPFETLMPPPAAGSCRPRSGHSLQNFRPCWWTDSRQFVQQRLCLFEIRHIEAFGEPAVDGCEQIAGLGAAALVAAQPG